MTDRAEALRILVISEYFPPKIFGGGEISAALLATGLAERRHRVTVLTSSAPELEAEEQVGDVRILRRLRGGASPDSLISNVQRVLRLPTSLRRETRRLEAQERFDAALLLNVTSIVPLGLRAPTVAVINGYTPFCPKGNLYFQERQVCSGCSPRKLASCLPRSRYAGRSPMPPYLRYNPLFWLALYLQYLPRRRALGGVDRFVAISGFLEGLLKGHSVGPERVERIYNLARIEAGSPPPPELRERLQCGKRRLVVLGGLEKIKGVDLALRAFARWRREGDRLLLAGDGSERAALEDLAQELGLREAVDFLGRVDPTYVPALYGAAHAVLLPSRWPEPFSRVVMEAARHGAPLLAAARGGNLDLPEAHLFRSEDELVAKLDTPPIPAFEPYDPDLNLGRFEALIRRVKAKAR